MFGVKGSQVKHVFVGGRQVVENGTLLTLDEAEVAAEARRLAPQVWAAFEKIVMKEEGES